jgi:hypothetical protein
VAVGVCGLSPEHVWRGMELEAEPLPKTGDGQGNALLRAEVSALCAGGQGRMRLYLYDRTNATSILWAQLLIRRRNALTHVQVRAFMNEHPEEAQALMAQTDLAPDAQPTVR